MQSLQHAAQAIRQETHKSMCEVAQRLADCKDRAASCSQVMGMLKGLPAQGTGHDIMLPLGKAAFLPARLTNINCCHMTLGERAESPLWLLLLPESHLPYALQHRGADKPPWLPGSTCHYILSSSEKVFSTTCHWCRAWSADGVQQRESCGDSGSAAPRP